MDFQFFNLRLKKKSTPFLPSIFSTMEEDAINFAVGFKSLGGEPECHAVGDTPLGWEHQDIIMESTSMICEIITSYSNYPIEHLHNTL